MTTIRAATPADGPGMLRLIESQPANGGMKLLYTRRPDAYQSYRTECPSAEIVVGVDGDRVVAQAVCLPRQMYIDGQAKTMGYITGLHKYAGEDVRVMDILEFGYAHSVAPQFFCSMLVANPAVLARFESQGNISPIADYTTCFLRPSVLVSDATGINFRRASADDAPRLLKFYREQGARYSYFPEFSSMLDFPNLDVTDFFLVEDAEGIVAAGALWDQRTFKQYVVLDYRGGYRLAARWPALVRALQYPPLPPRNTPARFAYLSFVMCRGEDTAVTKALLAGMAYDGGRRFDFLTIGAVNGSWLGRVLAPLKGIRIGSRLCAIHYHDAAPPSLGGTQPYFECGML